MVNWFPCGSQVKGGSQVVDALEIKFGIIHLIAVWVLGVCMLIHLHLQSADGYFCSYVASDAPVVLIEMQMHLFGVGICIGTPHKYLHLATHSPLLVYLVTVSQSYLSKGLGACTQVGDVVVSLIACRLHEFEE